MAAAIYRRMKFLFTRQIRLFPVFIIIGIAFVAGCASNNEKDSGVKFGLIDSQATAETKALYKNLKSLGKKNLLFGHHDTNSYGVKWTDHESRSDVKDVTGSFPAIYGWDVGELELRNGRNLDKVDFKKMQNWIKAAYKRGAINTISWHMDSPVTGGSSWEKVPTVKHLLPGGSSHEKFKNFLDSFVEFNENLKVADKNGVEHYIPIIFRPWHEHNGDWFWWGKKFTDEADFIAMWRFVVEYFRDEKNIHNLIYTYSPDRSRMDINNFKETYMYAYPGDDYVDIIGFDNYWDLGHRANKTPPEQQIAYFGKSLEYVAEIALEKNKVAALTEGGSETIPNPKFWTEVVIKKYLENKTSQNIAYLLVWRNANKAREKHDHYYAPYPGHPSAEDFVKFYKHPNIYFEDELPNMYK